MVSKRRSARTAKANIQTQVPELGLDRLDAVTGGTFEVTDYGFGISQPVTTSRSDGGGATVTKAGK